MRRAFLASLLLFVSPVNAQSTVSPAHFASAEATSSNRFPLGDVPSAPFRYLQVHDDLQGRPFPFRKMSFRRVGSPCGLPACIVPYPAYSLTLDAWCSTATTTSTTINTSFDANHGTDKSHVVTNKMFNFPVTMHGSVPQPFNAYVILFDIPFIYAAQGPLCWEVQVTAGNNTMPVYMGAASGSAANPPLGNAVFGTGCKASSQSSVMAASASSQMSWPTGSGNLIVGGTFAPPNGLVLTLLGIRDTNFSGIPLPFLIPGTSTAPSGPCSLYTDILLTAAVVADQVGTSTTTIPVPATLDLHGARTFEQNLALDPAANAPGLVLSNGVNHNWVAPYTGVPVGRLWLMGSLGMVGSSASNFGLVTQFGL